MSEQGSVGLWARCSLGLCECECMSPCVSSHVHEVVGLHMTGRSIVVCACVCVHL